MTTNSVSALLTTEEVASLLGCSTRQVLRHRAEGLPFIKFNRSVRFRADDVGRYIEDRGRKQLTPVAELSHYQKRQAG